MSRPSRRALASLALSGALACSFTAGFAAVCVAVSQPAAPPGCDCGLPRPEERGPSDRPLLSPAQRAEARETGRAAVMWDGVLYVYEDAEILSDYL